MNRTTVFDGNQLNRTVPKVDPQRARCFIQGTDLDNRPVSFPLSDDLLSKHLLFIGGIGMGKTNGIFQILSQLRNAMTPEDVMIIFDTKGDFYDAYYRPGDIVISNDEKATGPNGRDYWNIFEEIVSDSNAEEDIVEIARALFYERSTKSSQPFFPNAARTCSPVSCFIFIARAETATIRNCATSSINPHRRISDRSCSCIQI